jgi:hypothetical protein
MTTCRITFFLLFFFVTQSAWAQDLRFHAAGVLGLNMAQIDGDYSSGYRKPGVQAALRGVADFSKKTFMAMELSFSQQGAVSEPSALRYDRKIKGVEKFSIRLNYVEVPILFGFRSKKLDKYNFRHEWQFGLSIAQLMNKKISHQINFRDTEILTKYEPEFNTRILHGVIGYKVNFTPHWGLGIRHSSALTYLFDNPRATIQGERNYIYLRPFHVAALVYYTL